MCITRESVLRDGRGKSAGLLMIAFALASTACGFDSSGLLPEGCEGDNSLSSQPITVAPQAPSANESFVIHWGACFDSGWKQETGTFQNKITILSGNEVILEESTFAESLPTGECDSYAYEVPDGLPPGNYQIQILRDSEGDIETCNEAAAYLFNTQTFDLTIPNDGDPVPDPDVNDPLDPNN